MEGATDLDILQAFSKTLGHSAAEVLERPFVHYILNQPKKASEHFHGLREAKPDLVGLVVVDRLEREFGESDLLPVIQWQRREIENYLCFPDVLQAYAARLASERAAGPLFESVEAERFRAVRRRCLEDRVPPAALRDPSDRWWRDVKATDDFLDPVFESFFAQLDLPNLMRKTHYHRLAELVPAAELDPEIGRVLDRVLAVAQTARPVGDAEPNPSGQRTPQEGA
jgi:hypothetical protein